ncbi:MAG: hypothetical protein HY663_01560 [Chloroflexi bacterium]|nr:hypothetical protein [Chloroflexota bacterium]
MHFSSFWVNKLRQLSLLGTVADYLPCPMSVDAEVHAVENRLSRLYDALETGKLALDDLPPRIKELRTKQDELRKDQVIVEAEMTLEGYQQLDIDAIRSYAADLWNILEESEVAQRKAFLRSFVKKIVVEEERVKLYYTLPVPPQGRRTETVGVLPIDTPSVPLGTVPELLFEKKELMSALQQLIVSYSA